MNTKQLSATLDHAIDGYGITEVVQQLSRICKTRSQRQSTFQEAVEFWADLSVNLDNVLTAAEETQQEVEAAAVEEADVKLQESTPQARPASTPWNKGRKLTWNKPRGATVAAKGQKYDSKGRVFGSARTLNEAQVLEIRERAASGENVSDIASTYGITANYVRNVVAGRTWKHVGGLTPAQVKKVGKAYKKSGNTPGGGKLNAHKAREIKQKLAAGETRGEIAKQYHISTQMVDHIANGRAWASVTA